MTLQEVLNELESLAAEATAKGEVSVAEAFNQSADLLETAMECIPSEYDFEMDLAFVEG